MGVILDTSVLIEAERGNLHVETLTNGREEEPFGLSVISVAELLHGVNRADSAERRLKRDVYVEKVIELFSVYPFDMAAARVYAEAWAYLRKKGVQIGAHELIIGSTALALGFSVATFDKRHFERIDGLKVERLAP